MILQYLHHEFYYVASKVNISEVCTAPCRNPGILEELTIPDRIHIYRKFCYICIQFPKILRQFGHLGEIDTWMFRRRATTVYLADRRYDMLPGVLSANLCSLLGKDVKIVWSRGLYV